MIRRHDMCGEGDLDYLPPTAVPTQIRAEDVSFLRCGPPVFMERWSDADSQL